MSKLKGKITDQVEESGSADAHTSPEGDVGRREVDEEESNEDVENLSIEEKNKRKRSKNQLPTNDKGSGGNFGSKRAPDSDEDGNDVETSKGDEEQSRDLGSGEESVNGGDCSGQAPAWTLLSSSGSDALLTIDDLFAASFGFDFNLISI